MIPVNNLNSTSSLMCTDFFYELKAGIGEGEENRQAIVGETCGVTGSGK